MTLCANTTPKGVDLLQAAIHPYDETCRPQIVNKQQNPSYYDLINEFGKLTGIYALLNTSFNHHGSPIVSTIQDAIDVFFGSDLDGIIIGKFVIIKTHSDSN